MLPDQKNNSSASEETKLPEADTGNASNPSPIENIEPATTHQLLNKKAEKYLREAGNIEDMPDAQDEEEAEETLEKENKEQSGK